MGRLVAIMVDRSVLSSLAIVAPAFDEADGIEATTLGWIASLSAHGPAAHEVVVCNDGSRDRTGDILEAVARCHPVLRVVHHASNRGAAQAVATAVAASTANWILIVDADGQFPLSCLDEFARARHRDPRAAAFIGARRSKRDDRFARFGARVTTAALNAVYGTGYRDLSSACQLVRGDLLRALRFDARGLNYSVELSGKLLEAGIRPVEVEVDHLPRRTGRSTRTALRSTLDRGAFVSYLAVRKLLVAQRVLAPWRPPDPPT